MSRGCTLSVLGLYHADNTLFDSMMFPSGFSQDDKDTVIGNILAECAELEILFTDPGTLKNMIGLWSKINLFVWNRVFSAATLEYNPIENYNRTELETIADDRTDTHSGNDVNRASGTDTDTISSSNTETHSGTDTETKSSSNTENNTGTDITTNSVSSYDSNTYQPHDKTELQHGHSISNIGSGSNSIAHGHSVSNIGSGSTSTAYGKTETLTHGEVITHDGDITRNNHTSGNIGVTTSQQMLEQEIEISAKLNVMNMIVESFKQRFCLLVY